MDSSTGTAVATPQDDYQIEPPSSQQGASASADDYQIEIPHDSQQQGPVNPYAAPPGHPQDMMQAAPPQTWFQRAKSYVANSTPGENLHAAAPGLSDALGITPTESETAQQQRMADAGIYKPVTAVKQIGQGISRVSKALGIGDALVANADPNTPQAQAILNGPTPKADWDQAAAGGTQILSGGMELGKPLIPLAIAANAWRVGLGYITGVLAGYPADYLSDKFHLTPNEKQFWHTLAFFTPQAAADMMALHGSINPVVGRVADPGSVRPLWEPGTEHPMVDAQGNPVIDPGTGKPYTTGTPMMNPDTGQPLRDPATGKWRDINLRGAVVGGKGFGAGVAKGDPGQYTGTVRVGPYRVSAGMGGPEGFNVRGSKDVPGQPLFGPTDAATPPPAAPQPPAAPPSAPEVQAKAQIDEVTRLAATAQGTRVQAEQITGSRPPPPPKPKVPSPAGMDDGHLSQQTVETAGQVIQSLPPAARPSAVLEAVKNLGAWIAGKGTILGPDDQVVNVDTPKAAQTAATKIINAEMEKQKSQAEDAAAEKQTNLETAQQERDEAITPSEKSESTGNTPAVQIPKSPQVDRARAAIQGAPQDATADHFDQIIRKTALVTVPVRKALVQEEVTRRANLQEDRAETAMNGEAAAPGQSRTELQMWADGVKNGEHPFVHIPVKSSFIPAGVDGLTRTSVKGAGAFSGTYYHDPEVSAADIRKAARDKTDPQGALDAIVANWKEPAEGKVGDMLGAGETRLTATGRKTTPFPKVDTDSDRKTGNTLKRVDQWLMDNAIAEAKARGDDFNLRQFQANRDKPSPADKDSAEMYLFDKDSVQPVPKPFTKPVELAPEEVGELPDGGPKSPEDQAKEDKFREAMQGIIKTKLDALEEEVKPEPGAPTLASVKRQNPPQVAQPTKIGPVKFTITDRVGRRTPMKGDEYIFPGFEEYRIAVTKPRGSLANHDKLGWESHEIGSGARIYSEPFQNSTEQKTVAGTLNILQAQGKPKIDGAIEHWLKNNKQPEPIDRPTEPPVKLTPEATTGLKQIVEAAKADNPAATLDSILRDPSDGKIITQALVNDGIITNSDTDVNPTTSLLTTRARTKVGDALLSSILGPELTEQTPPFVREKLLGSMGSIGSIAETGPEWNLKPALEQAVAQYGAAFRGEEMVDAGPVVEAIVKKLDGSPEEMRKAFSNYAVSASAPGENPSPVLDFNVAFGTELTPEQFAEGLKAAPAAVASAPQDSTAPEPTPAAPRALQVGDTVSYTTNKGKTRTGTVAWKNDTKVRIDDKGSRVNKNVEDVKLVESPAAAPEANGEATLLDALNFVFDNGRGPKDYNGLKKIVADFDGTEPTQLRMKEAQEAYEAMLNRVASLIVLKGGSRREIFDRMVRLYEGQPNLSIRTSTSIDNQAYSTPLPLAFIADRFAGIDWKSTVYEPTAGNGALLISANPELARANELNPARAAMLKAEGFHVTQQDATTFTPAIRVNSVVANPPFGKLAAPIRYDNYNIVKLDHLIAVKALSVMKDEGRAAIIIGAGNREEPGEVTNAARPFFNYLYSHYNVVSDFEIDGDLYARQGASFPVRVIAIDGRTRTAKVSPVAEDIQRLKSWEEVYAKASEHLGPNLEGRQRADDVAGGSGELRPEPGAVPPTSARPSGQGNLGQPQAVKGGDTGDGLAVRQPGSIVHSGRVPDPPVGSPDITARPDGDVALSDRLAEGQSAPRVVRREPAELDGRATNAALATDHANAIADESNQFQATYTPRSEKKDVGIMAPKGLIAPMHNAMDTIAKDVGDLDQFVAGELGYPNVDELHSAFMGIQTDSIAAAIYQMKRGKAAIIGSQTGVGKGRIAAAMIRWGDLHGHLPIFITEKATLFSDIYRDLKNIGSGDTINPQLVNANSSITNQTTGEKVYRNQGAMRPVLDRIRETGQLPAGKNALFLTYSQINTDNRQQLTLHRLAPNSIFILDESHNAAGASRTGGFISEVIGQSRGVTFLSATWAKRPDNLPVYAGMTDISIAIPDKDKVVDAIAAGGPPLQAVVTNQLAKTGQFVRHETSFDGIDIKNVVDEDHRLQHEKISDKVSEVLRAILRADSAYHEIDFQRIVAEAEIAGKSANSQQIRTHMEFSSTVHNMVKQLLLALKADDSADKIIASIEAGERPIYALENTMGAFLSSYVDGNNLAEGDLLKGLTYSKISHRALMRTRYYNETDDKGGKPVRIEVPLEKLSPEVRAHYDAAQALIDKLNVDLPVSPIDHIRNRVEQAGYKIAEITGRDLRIDYSGDTPKLSTVPAIERKDRVNTATQYNNGQLDALVINRAASAGISLHASLDFLDQRPRHMFVGQPAGDVNVVIQMLGRINRTGQVVLPRYTFLSAALPAEMRPAIVLAKKMKSLNANVSSNTRSATSVKAVDMFNKYGDKIVAGYLLDNPEMERMLGVPVDVGENGEPAANEGKAMKATGHSALLPVKDQQAFMDAITEAYTNYVDYLDETGQNDLEPVTYDYDARETHTERMYQGTDPSSPFGQDANYGEYSIKRQGKPFTPEEVNAKIAETYGPELMKLAPYQRDTMFNRDLAHYFNELYKPYRESLTTDTSIERAGQMVHRGKELLDEYRVGSAFRVDIGGDEAIAVVTNIEGSKKTSGNPYAPSSLQFTLAINSPLRQIKVPGSQVSKITIANLGRNADINHLFKDVYGDSRQKVKIITGNLLGAYGELKAGVKGRIISFTMHDGTSQLGIQMPTKFDIKTDISDTYAMRSPDAAQKLLAGGDRVLQSSGQEISVFGPSHRDEGYTIRTKTSKATSGKFFLDPRLRELVVGGEFVSSGGIMKATVKDGEELDALKVIMGKIALYAQKDLIKTAREFDEKAQAGTLSKPSGLRKILGGEEGFAEVGAVVPPSFQRIAQKVGAYLQKAVPATWGELSKAVGTAVKTPKAIGYEIASVLYPAMLADADARDIMGRALGEPALELYKARLFMDGINKMFEGMPEEDWIASVDRKMTGQKQPTGDLAKAYEMMDSVIEGQRMSEQEAANLGRTSKQDKIVLQDRENYFPPRYSTPPGKEKLPTDEEQVARIGLPKRPFEGSKSFMKQKKYETLGAAIADGAVPLGNPVQMVLRRLQEGVKYTASQHALWNFRQTGIAVYKPMRGKMPANFAKVPDNIMRVFRPVETAEGGKVFVQAGEWVMDKDAARLLNNYLSHDWISGSTVGRGFIQLKTSSMALKMATSPFHYAMMTFWGMVEGLHSGIDEAYNQGVRGSSPEHLASGAKKMATFLINPVAKVVGADRIVRYLKNPDDFLDTPTGQKLVRDYPDLPELLRLVFTGGFRFGAGQDFPDRSPMSIGKDLKAGRGWSAVKKIIPAAAQSIGYPLFQFVIPRLKLMANVQMLSVKLEQYSEAISNGDITPETVARNVVAVNENSFGEFNYESNYWHSVVKTAMRLFLFAPGWKEGTWRTPAQAAKEVFTEGYADKYFEKVEAEGNAKGWAKYASKLPQLGLNTGRLLSAAIIATAIAAVVDELHKKGKPIWQHIEDDMKNNGLNFLQAADVEVLHPRTGEDNKYGEPVRYNLPSDLRDYEHAALHPGDYAFNSMAPWLIGTINTMHNRDFAGNYVYDPAGDEKFKQGLYYNLSQDFEPISVSNYLKKGGPQDTETKIEQTIGLIGGAPRGYDETRSVARALQLRQAHDPSGPLTPAQQSERDMLVAAPPTRSQARYALRTRNLTELDKIVSSPFFSYTDAKDVYDHATAEEKATLRPIMLKKQAAAVKKALGR